MSFTFEGDATEASFWLPFARNRQKMLESTLGMRAYHEGDGIGIGGKALTRSLSATFTPVDGVMILVKINPHHIHIWAGGCKYYLESGFYEIYSTALYNEGSYIAEKLRLIENGFLEEVMSCPVTGASGPPQGELKSAKKTDGLCDQEFPFYGGKCMHGDEISDGFESHAMGSPNFEGTSVLTINPLIGEVRKLTGGPFYEGLRTLKRAQMYTPSGYYTGKLRLFVQAIYGSVRNDYRWSFPDSGIPGITFQDFMLTADSGLVTLDKKDEYRYFLCRIESNDTISFRELLPSSDANCYLTFLKRYGRGLSRKHRSFLEAYIFSTCDLATEDQEINIPLGVEPEGSSADGWKFNGKGLEFSAVHQKFLYLDENDTYGHEEPHLYTFTIEYFIGGDSEVSFSISHTLNTYTPWQQNHYFVAWRPQYTPLLSHFSFGAGFPSARNPISDYAPICGYYEPDELDEAKDEYVMFWVKLNEVVNTSGDWDSGLPFSYPIDGAGSGEVWPEWGRELATNGYKWNLEVKIASLNTVLFEQLYETEKWDSKRDVTYIPVQYRSGFALDRATSFPANTYFTGEGQDLGAALGWSLNPSNYWYKVPDTSSDPTIYECVSDKSRSVAGRYNYHGYMAKVFTAMVAPFLRDRNGFSWGIREYNAENKTLIDAEAQTYNTPTPTYSGTLGHSYAYYTERYYFDVNSNKVYLPGVEVPALWKTTAGNNWNVVGTVFSEDPFYDTSIFYNYPNIYSGDIEDGYTLIDSVVEEPVFDPWHDVYFSQPPLTGPPIMLQTTLLGRGTYGGASRVTLFDENKSFSDIVNGYSMSYNSAVGWI